MVLLLIKLTEILNLLAGPYFCGHVDTLDRV